MRGMRLATVLVEDMIAFRLFVTVGSCRREVLALFVTTEIGLLTGVTVRGGLDPVVVLEAIVTCVSIKSNVEVMTRMDLICCPR